MYPSSTDLLNKDVSYRTIGASEPYTRPHNHSTATKLTDVSASCVFGGDASFQNKARGVVDDVHMAAEYLHRARSAPRLSTLDSPCETTPSLHDVGHT